MRLGDFMKELLGEGGLGEGGLMASWNGCGAL